MAVCECSILENGLPARGTASLPGEPAGDFLVVRRLGRGSAYCKGCSRWRAQWHTVRLGDVYANYTTLDLKLFEGTKEEVEKWEKVSVGIRYSEQE